MDTRRDSKGARVVLALLFVTLLGGRFTFDGFSSSLGSIDVRWVLVPMVLVAFTLWVGVETPPVLPRGTGSLLVWFSAWCAWMVTTGLWVVDGSDYLTAAVDFVLLWFLTAITAGVFTRISMGSVRLLWDLSLAAGLIYLLAALGSGSGDFGRLAAFGGGPNVFVRVVVLGAISAVAIAVHSNRALPLLAVPVLLVGALLSGSRGGVLAAIVVLLIGALVLLRIVGIKRVFKGALLLGAIALAAWQFVPYERREYLYSRFVVQTLDNHYTSGRDELAEHALRMFEQNPFFGAGIGSFAATFGDPDAYSHNLFLSVASEAGIVGLLLLAGCLLSFAASIRARLNDPAVAFASLAALCIFITSMFSGDYYDTRFLWFFMVIATVLSRRRPQVEVHESQEHSGIHVRHISLA